MSGPWLNYQQGGGGNGPWVKYQTQATPQPSPGQMDQDLANVPRPQEEPFDPMASMFAVQPSPAVPTGASQERRSLGERGIMIGNAPIGTQFRAGFGRTVEEAYKAQGYETTTDPNTGRTLFRRSDQEPWTTISEPGLPTVGDIAGMAGGTVREVPAAIGGAAGTIGGMMIGGPIGASALGAAGGGVGAGAGEAARLKIGKSLGVVPGEADISGDALTSALLAAGFGGLMSAGMTARMAFQRLGVPRALRGLTPQQLEAVYETARQKVAGTGLEDTLRPSQAFAAAGGNRNANIADELAAMEQSTLRTGGSGRDPLANSMREQIGVLEGQTSRLQGEAPMLAPEQVGQGAQRAAMREVREDLRSAVERTGGGAGKARAEALESQKVLEPAIQPDYVGEPIRQRVLKAYDAAEERASAVYERAKAGTGDLTGPVRNTVAALEADRENVAKILLPSLTEQDRPLIESGLKRMESGTASVDEIQQTLKAIRRQIRQVNTGVATTDTQQLMRLEKALQADRDAMLGPERAKALTDAEAGWRTLRDEFNRAPLIDRVLARKSGGAERVEDFQLGRLTLNPDNAKALANVLKGDLEAMGMLKSAMREKAREAAGITGTGKVANPDAYQAWLRKNDPMLSAVFTQQERKAMLNPARMEREFLQRESALNDVRKTIEQRYKQYGIERDFAGRIKDPSSYVENVIGSGNAELARQSFSLLKRRDPTTAGEMQAIARQMLSREITGGGKRPSSQAIQNFFSAPEKVRVYREILGPEFQDRLTRLARALDVVSPERITAAVGDPAGSFRQAIQGLQRITMSPLSAMSRRTTFFRGMSEDQISDKIGRAIVDQKAFTALIKSINESRYGRATAVGAGAAYGSEKGEQASRKYREYSNGR